MSELRAIFREDTFSETGGVTDPGGVLASSFTVAIVTAAIGWYLVQNAGWQLQHLVTGLIGFIILSALISLLWIARYDGNRFGEANQATLLRAGLVCLIGSTLLASGQQPEITWHLFGLTALALALDGVDGFLARRLNLATTFGARFDMEIDALLLMILSLLVWQTGQAGVWVLLIGLIRYVFVAASWFCARLAAPLRPSFRRKTVCALQGIALLTCLLPPLDQTMGSAIAFAALTALIASFGLDIRTLLQGALPHRAVAVRTIKEEANT
ncbi:MAG: CDP-alcohol phosphatidyltransferase family protein [Geminicoccaceae bacterium]